MIKFIKKFINNDYLFSVIVKVLGLFIGIILSVLTARYFGSELKGVTAVIENNTTLYAIFLGLGIYQAYPFFRKQNPGIYHEYLNNVSTLFVIYEIIAVMVACVMFHYEINTYLAVSIILMPIEVYIKQLNYVVLIENPRRRNMSSLIISLSEFVVILIFWVFFEATVATAIAYFCCAIGFNLILSFVNLRMSPFKLRFSVSKLWELIKFGFVPMLTYLCMTINYKIDIQMLELFDNVSYAQIGIYSVGVSLASKIWLIPDAIKDILLSKLVKGKKESEVARVIRISTLVCIVSIIGLIAVGKPLITLLYGKEYEETYYIMVMMLIGVLGMIFYKMVYSYNVAQGKRAINLIFLGTAAVTNVIGNLILIPNLGIYGAAITSIVSYNVCGICFLVYFHKVSKISFKEILVVQKSDITVIKGFLLGNKK